MKPKVLIIGGPNGVGKTTFAYQYRDTFNLKYLGADEIAAELSQDVIKENLNAGRLFFKRLTQLAMNSESFIVESTLSGVGLVKQIDKLKKLGYQIEIVFVYLSSAEHCKERVKIRVQKGGHNVPPSDIERRYYRSISNFHNVYSKIADSWQIFNNDTLPPQEVAASELGTTMIFNDKLYQTLREIKQ